MCLAVVPSRYGPCIPCHGLGRWQDWKLYLTECARLHDGGEVLVTCRVGTWLGLIVFKV